MTSSSYQNFFLKLCLLLNIWVIFVSGGGNFPPLIDVVVRQDQIYYQDLEGGLLANYSSSYTGQDEFGVFTSYYTIYNLKNNQSFQMVAETRKYPENGIAIHIQRFPTGLYNAATNDRNAVITGHPCYSTGAGHSPVGFWSLGDYMLGWMQQTFGIWGNSDDMKKIADGTKTGPLMWLDQSGHSTKVITPFDNFMALQAAVGSPSPDAMCWGVMGNVSSLPPGFTASFIEVELNNSLSTRDTMLKWGEIVTKFYKRTSSARESDMSVNYLGYYTDNGAYYYYNTEPEMNYQETIEDLAQYFSEENIPYRYFQYDSWFYPKVYPKEGVIQWTGEKDIFPDNMTHLYNKLQIPIVAHNRWWAPVNVYAKQNGGLFDFIVEENYSLPMDPRFWDYLFQQSKPWGLLTYEQDWQNAQFEDMVATTSDLTVASTWLLQMGEAASRTGVFLQYCMALPRSALQSLLVPSVSQARVSDDYQPGNEQWRIGHTSLLAWALNLAPFKDNFWTSQTQSGNPYNLNEPYPELESVVATLSWGPVAPGDKKGSENKSLIMRSIAQDGTILKPDRPAFAIDNQALQLAGLIDNGPMGEVWTTYSRIGGYTFGVIFAADLKKTYRLKMSELGFEARPSDIVYNVNANTFKTFAELGGEIVLEGCTKKNFCLFYTTPNLRRSSYYPPLYLTGDLSKWVPNSSKRFTQISLSPLNELQISVFGGAGENVTISLIGFFAGSGFEPFSFTCTMTESGFNIFIMENQNCLY